MQYHEVKINIDIRPIGECLWAVSSLDSDAKAVSAAYQQSLVSCSLYVDYIFLEQEERRKMAQNGHEYLIEQLQFTGDESIGAASSKIKLNFNHPCKELIWVVQPDANVDYCSSLKPDSVLFKVMGAQPFNYTDAIDALPPAIHAFGATANTSGDEGFVTSAGLFEMAGAAQIVAGSGNLTSIGSSQLPFYGYAEGDHNVTSASGVSDAGTFVLAQTALDMHCWGENPVVTAKLCLNGQDRISEREGPYFDVVQPWQHHSRHPDTGINVYSFALRPEELQPSGSLNFSRIDTAALHLVLSSNAIGGVSTCKVRIYSKSYNIIRFISGMAGLSYSS